MTKSYFFSILVSAMLLSTFTEAEAQSMKFDSIRVAVRSDAAPFSFLKPETETENLADYSGFIIEVCREVLAEVTKHPPFRDAEIIPIKVTAADRFKQLEQHQADILCGPTSITSDRVLNFNISAPVFLSGIANASQHETNFPRSFVCDKTLVGYVTNTTAETHGIRIMSEGSSYFGRRFSPAINWIINERDKNSISDNNNFYEGLVGQQLNAPEFLNVCTTKFSVPPIIEYAGHDTGLKNLCEGKILYYVADLGIISEYLRNNPNCLADLDRSVALVENYGIMFRKPSTLTGSSSNFKALTLYSSFNRHLTLLMQKDDGVLERAYMRTFGERQKSSALSAFFKSLAFRTR